jgi:hypothetical protein
MIYPRTEKDEIMKGKRPPMSNDYETEKDDREMSDSSRKHLQPSFEDLLAGRGVPPEMLRDLYAISRLDTSKIPSIVTSIRQLDGLGSHDTFEQAIKVLIGDTEDKDVAKSVRRAINSLTPSAIPDVMESLEKWVSAKSERKEFFTDESLAQLRANLTGLISNNDYGKLIRKAERLLRDVGNEFRGMKFVCDLRPIFDDKREKVDAFVVLANLRVHYVNQCGDQQSFELALTEDELVQMGKDVENALKKVDVLKSIRKNVIASGSSSEVE